MPPTGFPKDLFVHQQVLADAFDCAICLNVLRDPVLCPNSHTFCRACMTLSLERSPSCPTCREGVPKLLPNLPVRNFLAAADVICTTRLDGVEGNRADEGSHLDSTPEASRKRSRSPDQAAPAAPAKLSKHNENIETAAATPAAEQDHCPWIGKLKDADTHLLLCPFALVPCQHAGCEVKVMRRLMEQHQLGCPYRPPPCQHCHTYLPFRQLASHFISCTKRPVPCPNGCLQDEEQVGGSVTNVPFDQLSQHRSVCPLELVPCKHVGCEVNVVRRLLEQHQLGCPYRPSPCQHCQTNMPFHRLASHFTSCSKRPVPCPNGCLQDEEQGGGTVTKVMLIPLVSSFASPAASVPPGPSLGSPPGSMTPDEMKALKNHAVKLVKALLKPLYKLLTDRYNKLCSAAKQPLYCMMRDRLISCAELEQSPWLVWDAVHEALCEEGLAHVLPPRPSVYM